MEKIGGAWKLSEIKLVAEYFKCPSMSKFLPSLRFFSLLLLLFLPYLPVEWGWDHPKKFFYSRVVISGFWSLFRSYELQHCRRCNSCTSYVGGDYCPDCAQHDCCVARPPEDWDCGPFEAHYLVTLSEDLKQIEKVQLWYHLN
jgi:hypothetical protein